jgi:hypothetical protein
VILGLLPVERIADIIPDALAGGRKRIPHGQIIDDRRTESDALVCPGR